MLWLPCAVPMVWCRCTVWPRLLVLPRARPCGGGGRVGARNQRLCSAMALLLRLLCRGCCMARGGRAERVLQAGKL